LTNNLKYAILKCSMNIEKNKKKKLKEEKMEFFEKEKVKVKREIMKLMERECRIEERFLAAKAAREKAVNKWGDPIKKKLLDFCQECGFSPSEFFVYSCLFMKLDVVIAKGKYRGKKGYISPFLILFEEEKWGVFSFDIRNWPPLYTGDDIGEEEVDFKFRVEYFSTRRQLQICGVTLFVKGIKEEFYLPID